MHTILTSLTVPLSLDQENIMQQHSLIRRRRLYSGALSVYWDDQNGRAVSLTEDDYYAKPECYIKALFAKPSFQFYDELDGLELDGVKLVYNAQGNAEHIRFMEDNLSPALHRTAKRVVESIDANAAWYPMVIDFGDKTILPLQENCPRLADFEVMLDWMGVRSDKAGGIASLMEMVAFALTRRSSIGMPRCLVCRHVCAFAGSCGGACPDGCTYSRSGDI